MSSSFENTLDFVARYDAMVLGPFMRALYGQVPYYNVGDWSQGASTLPQACEALMDRVLAHLPDARGRVLDAGCGLGAGTRRLARHLPTARVTGINLSARQLERAALHCPEACFEVMDATRMTFADESFAAIVSVEAALHFSTRARFLREAERVLMPGGSLILTDILFGTPDWIGGWTVPRANFVADTPAYATECAKAGLEVERLEDITDVSWQPYARYLGAWAETTSANGTLTRADADAIWKLSDELTSLPAQYLFARLRKPG